MKTYGYIRVSSRDQIEDRQLVALSEAGIAAAKGRGVKFGRPPLPLPPNFYEIHKTWREKKLTLKEAANACRMPEGIFYGKARKYENEGK